VKSRILPQNLALVRRGVQQHHPYDFNMTWFFLKGRFSAVKAISFGKANNRSYDFIYIDWTRHEQLKTYLLYR